MRIRITIEEVTEKPGPKEHIMETKYTEIFKQELEVDGIRHIVAAANNLLDYAEVSPRGGPIDLPSD